MYSFHSEYLARLQPSRMSCQTAGPTWWYGQGLRNANERKWINAQTRQFSTAGSERVSAEHSAAVVISRQSHSQNVQSINSDYVRAHNTPNMWQGLRYARSAERAGKHASHRPLGCRVGFTWRGITRASTCHKGIPDDITDHLTPFTTGLTGTCKDKAKRKRFWEPWRCSIVRLTGQCALRYSSRSGPLSSGPGTRAELR
ncbi:hypothetical protein K437DRAFT_296631 [Tilletiaria anomala UBC 951]|uniref:Uncharacterized protein n=1 Tax=Tilletiaria anomala (strain ATCC 24038 / CBS 436.72 / UBC 951) TaxID=1037660 RepID=A0A066VEP7_TILAU|nr:uncharacterized protein K437DRAFT_296631 [Tilletiaria anomala UBC 951]KDN37234.1 hypothetical protein K437DRAFT_296631 [Tilletiaria anomala UBC 951]